MIMVEWLSLNETWLSLIISFLSLIVTSILTGIIIVQTSKLDKKQSEQELEITKQQAELQEKQIKISMYERKDEINKTLNVIFDIADCLGLIINNPKIESFSQDKLYDLLKTFIGDINKSNISYTLEQSRFFLNAETYLNIKLIRMYFLSLTTSIDCLDLLKNDEEIISITIEEIRESCTAINNIQPLIKNAMIQEMTLL